MEQSNINIVKTLNHLGAATVEINALQDRCDKYEKCLNRILEMPTPTNDNEFKAFVGYARAAAREALSGEGKEVEKPMEYNVCETCGAGGGKAGILINNECRNCYETRKTRAVTIHTNLERTQEEIDKTIGILNQKEVK